MSFPLIFFVFSEVYLFVSVCLSVLNVPVCQCHAFLLCVSAAFCTSNSASTLRKELSFKKVVNPGSPRVSKEDNFVRDDDDVDDDDDDEKEEINMTASTTTTNAKLFSFYLSCALNLI